MEKNNLTNALKLIYRSITNSIQATKNMLFVTQTRNDYKHIQTRLISEIQRNIHQIEKGLSISKPKYGFGYKKIEQIIFYLQQLDSNNELQEIRNIAGSCINAYFQFYKEQNWNNDEIEKLREKFKNSSIQFMNNPDDGGIINIKKKTFTLNDFNKLSEIAKSRHSVREFSGEVVDDNILLQAVKFAQMAPSACNRQAVRCYIIDKYKYENLSEWLGDIGYFGDVGFDKIILITAKITGYNASEGMQHLVSPGLFTGYLVLALEALNVGACVIQRSLNNDRMWINVRNKLGIPDDEQSFCLVGCGTKKDEYKVPVSKRMSVNAIVKII